MALILFPVSMFGLLSVLRIARGFHSRALISPHALTKIGTGACVIVILLAFLGANRPIVAAFACFASVAALFSALKWLERRQIDALRAEIPIFLDRWILDLRLGNSLTAARDAALRESSDRFSRLLRPFFIGGPSALDSHPIFDSGTLNEMRALAESAHSALDRLKNLREMIRKTDAFRRKSGQAVRQTAIQAQVLLCLQFALAVYAVHRHGWANVHDVAMISGLLSVCGVFLMRWMAGRVKWKI
ncbi:MAG TPA: hypothetical protein PKC28_00765 [Bdellovibrionales bacterium]|nr:hypothetical protein [Bdellovibrionales bacterium]